MIDWHSHILPKMDDGSSCIGESISMLERLSEQNIKFVIATPHFYADNNTVDEFLKKRELSYKKLISVFNNKLPNILLGAEVCFYPGISNLQGLSKLCIEGTKLLLLEMPMSRWTEHTVKEIISLANSGDYIVVLAHIERYVSFQSDKVLEKISKSGILMQMNASFLNHFSRKRKAFKLLSKGFVQFLGSDCHNLDSRPPRIGEAIDVIRKKFGDDSIDRMNEFGYELLNL